MSQWRTVPAAVMLAIAVMQAAVAASLPVDVTDFKERRDACDHFRGEDPYDEERRQFLEKQMTELCTGSDEQLKKLKHRYRDNRAVQVALAEYEPHIEASSPPETQNDEQ